MLASLRPAARRGLLLALLVAPPFSAVAQELPVDRVIRDAIEAMGGIDRIRALRSLVLRGFHYEGSYRQEFEGSATGMAVMARMRPGLRLVGCRPEIAACEGRWGRILEGFDGARGWELNWPRQRLVRTVNKAEQALRCGAEFDYAFIDYAARGFAATDLGPQTLIGVDTVAVRIDRAGCTPEIFHFDPVDHALLMQQLSLPLHARGAAVATVSVHRDYRVVAGVRLPSRSEQVALETGEVLGGGTWTTMEGNTLDDRSIFEPPEVHPMGITAVVLEMLRAAEVDGVTPMLAYYDRFRSTSEGRSVDTTYDLNWLGFELLKVDDYPAAIAVFERVIAEHPDSASAEESLADAYAQQGDLEAAAEALDRAIQRAPSDARLVRKRRAFAYGT